jgi:N-acetyl sugar amidotransferase
MNLKGQICKEGIWDQSIPDITFDENGVSNYAHLFKNLIKAFPRGEEDKKRWENLVNEIKKKHKNNRYDCIIGVSGGTDSSYLLHISKMYGLRPLACNIDNGWNSDISIKNIKKMTEALKIDLETYVINYEEIKDLIKSYMKACLPWIDIPADLAIKAYLYILADKENVKYIFRGNDFRSEGSQPREWTYGDGRQLKYLNKIYGTVKLKSFPNYTLLNLIYYGFLKGIKTVYPFYYIDYNKREAQIFLKNNYGWEYYGGHHYENLFTKFCITYWLYEKFKIDKRVITYSAQILSGEISREFALNEINKLPYDLKEINNLIEYVIKKLDLSKEDFQKIFLQDNKSYKDYPSYDFLFKKYLKITKPFLKYIFLHKPQSIFQIEMK